MDAVALIAALTAFGTLAWSGFGHMLRPRGFRADIAEQRLVHSALAAGVAGVVVIAELTIGACGVASLLAGSAGTAKWFGVAATALYLAYAGYNALLLLLRPEAPCGCDNAGTRVSAWSIGRATGLAAAAATAAAGSPTTVAGIATLEVAIVGLASGALAVSLWNLPAALAVPQGGRT